MICED